MVDFDRRGDGQVWPSLVIHTEGSGPNLVLLHGGTGSWTHWYHNIPLWKETCQVHAFDLPGFGGSPNVPLETSPDDYLSWCRSAIHNLIRQVGPIHLVGFSFGSVIAANAAAHLGGDIRSLVLVGAAGFGSNHVVKIDRVPPGATQEERRETAIRNLNALMISDRNAIDELALDLTFQNSKLTRYNSRSIGLLDVLIPDLGRSSCPLLVVYGEQDQSAAGQFPERIRRLKSCRPEVQITFVPNAGHWVQYERPAEVNSAILSFIASVKSNPMALANT